MASITFTVPNDQVARIVAAMKTRITVPNQDEMTDGQYAKAAIGRVVINFIRAHETELARQAAVTAVTDIDIT